MFTKLTTVAAIGLLASGAAVALPLATIDGRSSVAYVTYSGGFAIAGDSGTGGAPAPVTALSPPTLGTDGGHTFVGAYLGWSVTYTVNWNLTQSWAVDPAAHTLSGQGAVHLDESSAVVGPNCAPCAATVSITGTDTQQLMFTLSAATDYQFHSETTSGQWLDLLVWNAATQRWSALWFGAFDSQDKVFDHSGTLAAGRYRLQNNPYTFTADSSPPVWDNAWSYTLTLPGAQVSAVPEPGAAWLWLLGLPLLLRRRAQRPRRNKRSSSASVT